MAYYPHRVPRAGSLRATWRAAFGSPKLPESPLSGLSRRDAPPTAMQRKLPLALAGWTSAPGQYRSVARRLRLPKAAAGYPFILSGFAIY